MQNLKIFNKKESKRIIELLKKHWGFEGKLDYVFLQTERGRIYLANREIFDLDFSKLKINAVGIYFADITKGIRLSIEGSQMIGPFASKNVVELDNSEIREWMKGNDIEKETESEDFVIIKRKDDFFGSGKSTKDGKILNFVPKIRRLAVML